MSFRQRRLRQERTRAPIYETLPVGLIKRARLIAVVLGKAMGKGRRSAHTGFVSNVE